MFVDEKIGGVSYLVSKMFVDVVCCCFFHFFKMLLIVCPSVLEAALKLDSCPQQKYVRYEYHPKIKDIELVFSIR